MALACFCVFSACRLHAQNPGQVRITDQREFNAYQRASTERDPGAKASALEVFLQTYPQSVVEKIVLDLLVDTYQGLGNTDEALGAASRLLQVDPENMKAIYISAVIKKAQCGKTQDVLTCDDGATLARKGLATAKPAGTSDSDWKNVTGATYPMYHSVIALDDAVSMKDFKAAEKEYTQELMLYTDAQSRFEGLADTLQLATAYSLPGSGQDLAKSVWFFARVWNFAPPAYKAQIEAKLKYYYNKYHGSMDGLDEVKIQSAATVFPPGTLDNEPAAAPAPEPAPTESASGGESNSTAPPKYQALAPPLPPPPPAPSIAIGQSKDQVTAAFGEPQRKATAGTKEIFFYTDLKMKVTFTNGKVSSIE
jgi:hypothetical protein